MQVETWQLKGESQFRSKRELQQGENADMVKMILLFHEYINGQAKPGSCRFTVYKCQLEKIT